MPENRIVAECFTCGPNALAWDEKHPPGQPRRRGPNEGYPMYSQLAMQHHRAAGHDVLEVPDERI